MSAIGEPIIRQLAVHDLEAAVALSNAAGWNQLHDDWEMLLRSAPGGSFAAFLHDRLVGTALGINYGTFAWIAMMLVDPELRGHGIGRRLLEAALDALPSDTPVRLDATPLGRPLYRKYGFEDQASLIRYVRQQSSSVGRVASSTRARCMTRSDLRIVSDCDRQVFGGDRALVLEWAFRNAPHYAYLVSIDDEAIGFCLGRRGRLFDQIGPVIAREDEQAQALVNVALEAAHDRPVAIDAFEAHTPFTTWLAARGFTSQRPLFRMSLPRGGGQTKRLASLGEFAILGPEFG